MFRIKLQSLRGAGPRHIEFAAESVLLLETAVNLRVFADLVRGDAAIQNWRSANEATGHDSRLFGFIESFELGEASARDFCVDLEIVLSVRPDRDNDTGKPKIETPFWLIDDCIRRRDQLDLACDWLFEWLRPTRSAKRPARSFTPDSKLAAIAKAVGPDIVECIGNPRQTASREEIQLKAIAQKLVECLKKASEVESPEEVSS